MRANDGVRRGGGLGRRWSLRARFVLVATASLLPLLGVVLFVLYQSLGQGRDQLLDAQQATTDVLAQSLAATLDANAQALSALATANEVRKLDEPDPDAAAARERALAQFRLARPELAGLFLVGAEGGYVSHVGVDPRSLWPVPSFEPTLHQALTAGGPALSNLLPDGEEQLIAIVVPVTDQGTGKAVGAVGGLLAEGRLRDSVLPFARGDTVIAIAAGDPPGVITKASASDLDRDDLADRLARPIAEAVAGAVGTDGYRDAGGVERLVTYAPVDAPAAGWAVLVSNPAPTGFAANRMLVERGLAALALAVAATLILAVVLGEWVARPVRGLTEQAAAVARGDFRPGPLPDRGGELGLLGAAFREMADRLAGQVHDLEAAREAGAAQAEQMRELHRRTVRLQEDERRRLAAEIHDAVAPLITGALYQTRALRLSEANGANGANGDGAGVEARASGLDAVGDLLTRSMEELHNVIFALRPPDLDDIGVVAAIERHVAQVGRSGLACRLEVVGDPPALTPEVRLAVYRIVQEALHTALRHAAADEAVVRLEVADGLLRVSIRDNGAGFDPARGSRPTALGLLSMRERARAIGASFGVASRPGDGTTVTIERRMETEGAEEMEGVEAVPASPVLPVLPTTTPFPAVPERSGAPAAGIPAARSVASL